MKKLTFVFVLFLIVLSCKNDIESEFLQVNYYHWAQEYNQNSAEKEILNKAKSTKLYTRFFDIQWDREFASPIPQSVIEFKQQPNDIEIVPTIYITNEVMKNLSDSPVQIKDLARRTIKKINNIADTTNLKVSEIQFDCDWSQSSKEPYFEFLNQAKTFMNDSVGLSATIRLHQVKYADKTGVPPVDKGVLMVYNMGKIGDENETNSIFNRKITDQYLFGYEEYQLPLDLALPAFSWAIKTSNYGHIRIIEAVSAADLNATGSFKQLSENQFLANKSGMINGHYFSINDQFRIEYPTVEDIEWAKKTFGRLIKNKTESPEIIFYEIGSQFLAENSKESQFFKP